MPLIPTHYTMLIYNLSFIKLRNLLAYQLSGGCSVAAVGCAVYSNNVRFGVLLDHVWSF